MTEDGEKRKISMSTPTVASDIQPDEGFSPLPSQPPTYPASCHGCNICGFKTGRVVISGNFSP